jgi:hypothetical protein
MKNIEEVNYAVFILTHGRPDNVITYKTLRKLGYEGKIYLIIDSDDKTKDVYLDKFKGEVIVFNKKDYYGKFDVMDNLDNDKVIVYARNAIYDIARSLNLDYFFEYEDDYTAFFYRYEDNNVLRSIPLNPINKLFEYFIEFMETTPTHSLALAQGGDLIGGVGSLKNNNYKRKAMNSFIFRVNKDKSDDILFLGRMNDDVNMYLNYGKRGYLFFQIAYAHLCQLQTQKQKSGNSEVYKKLGTYTKSFYSVIIEPSCCKVYEMGSSEKRIHHSIKWINAVPCIIEEKYKKHA